MSRIPRPPTQETASIEGTMSAIRRKNFHAIGARNDPDACSFVLMLAPPREGSALEKAPGSVTNKHRHQVCSLEKTGDDLPSGLRRMRFVGRPPVGGSATALVSRCQLV